MVRMRHSGRYPDHLWDGPASTLVDGNSPEHIRHASRHVKRRMAHVDNKCRRAFEASCARGGHPIDSKPNVSPVGDCEASSSLELLKFLHAHDSAWPKEVAYPGHPIRLFREEARRLGPRRRPFRGKVRAPSPGQSSRGRSSTPGSWTETDSRPPSSIGGHGAVFDPVVGQKVYRDTTWLNQRLLYFTCEDTRMIEGMISMLVRFAGSGGHAPLVRPVPFIMERHVRQACAATSFQAAWRAYVARRDLPCNLRTAMVIRRATLCIQQAWRWSLVRRRLELLAGAARAAKAVKGTCLYIEDRLLTALNNINSVNRFAPLLEEKSLGFGFSADTNRVVLVRPDLRGHTAKGWGSEWEARTREREGGLPAWLWNSVELQAVSPTDPTLKCCNGLHGLLLEGLGERAEDHIVSVSMPSIEHAARLLESDCKGLRHDRFGRDRGAVAGVSAAQVVAGVPFHFVELRFSSLKEARRKAFMLFLCTFSSRHRSAVPLFTKSALYSPSSIEVVLKLWETYGLTWTPGDRAVVALLRQRVARPPAEVVPLCGREPWASVSLRSDADAWRGPTASARQTPSRLSRPSTRATTRTATATTVRVSSSPLPPLRTPRPESPAEWSSRGGEPRTATPSTPATTASDRTTPTTKSASATVARRRLTQDNKPPCGLGYPRSRGTSPALSTWSPERKAAHGARQPWLLPNLATAR